MHSLMQPHSRDKLPSVSSLPFVIHEGNSCTLVLRISSQRSAAQPSWLAGSVASTCTAGGPDLLDGFSLLIGLLLG